MVSKHREARDEVVKNPYPRLPLGYLLVKVNVSQFAQRNMVVCVEEVKCPFFRSRDLERKKVMEVL